MRKMNKVILILIIAWAAFVFGMADFIAYGLAAYPERTRCVVCKLPGGGFVALWKFGRQAK